jgi:hypothetical protein
MTSRRGYNMTSRDKYVSMSRWAEARGHAYEYVSVAPRNFAFCPFFPLLVHTPYDSLHAPDIVICRDPLRVPRMAKRTIEGNVTAIPVISPKRIAQLPPPRSCLGLAEP